MTTSGAPEIGRFTTRPIIDRTIPDGGDPVEFGAACEGEHAHHPMPRYLELHHVVPRAWQNFWKPETVRSPFHAPNKEGIWAPFTIVLCRTAHGNVHYWIERAMKAYMTIEPGPDHSERAMHVARQGQQHIGEHETALAREALVLFSDAGGSLRALATAGLWGGLYGGNDAPG
jgi:hypothetical protein